MAIPFVAPIGQVVGGNWQPTNGLTTVNLRVSPYAVATYTQDSALGDGCYKFNAVANGEYKVFVGSVEQTYFGVIKIGISSPSEVPALVDATKIADGSVTNTEFQYINSLTSNAQTQITGKVSKAGGSLEQISTPLEFISQFPLIDSALGDPSGQQVAYAQWVSDLVASIIVTPYQQASKKRRIIANGTLQGNQVYTSFGSCTAAISDNAIANQYRVFLEQGTSYASTQDNLYYVLVSQFKNYINVIGDGRSTYVVLDGSTSISINCILQNFNLYLGVNNISGARTLQSLTLKDIDIYAYNDLTINNCYMENVNIFQPTAKTLTLSGTSSWVGGSCTNTLTNSATGLFSRVDTEINTNYTMPTDLSLAP